MGWIKLNSDGVVSLSGQHAFIGRILRDSNANWLYGYAMSFCKILVFKVETKTMLKGLFIIREKSFKKIEVECDKTLLIELNLTREASIIIW